MTESVLTAVLLTAAATLGVHLGLPQAVAQVVLKISKCHKCLSFWLTLLGLTYTGCGVAEAALLSICAAYMSQWLGLPLVWLTKKFDKLWEKLSK